MQAEGVRMKAPLSIADIGPNTPLRLAEAVQIAFPAGGMTVSGLRREIARKRLTVELIAGKQFTTLEFIAEMRKQCRVQAKVPGCGFDQSAEPRPENSKSDPPGSSGTAKNMSAQDALQHKLQRLKKSSGST